MVMVLTRQWVEIAVKILEDKQKENPEPAGGWGEVGESRDKDPCYSLALNLLVSSDTFLAATKLIFWEQVQAGHLVTNKEGTVLLKAELQPIHKQCFKERTFSIGSHYKGGLRTWVNGWSVLVPVIFFLSLKVFEVLLWKFSLPNQSLLTHLADTH
jgi:hypothetical protein